MNQKKNALEISVDFANPIDNLTDLDSQDLAMVITTAEKAVLWYPYAKTKIELGKPFAEGWGFIRQRAENMCDFIRIQEDNGLQVRSYGEWSYSSCEFFGKRDDGFYDYITEDGVNSLDDDLRDFINHRNPDDNLTQVFRWDEEHEGYELIYRGVDVGSLLNAVLVPKEDWVALYRLWSNGVVEYIDSGKRAGDAEYVGIGDQIWYFMGIDNLFVDWDSNPKTKGQKMPPRK